LRFLGLLLLACLSAPVWAAVWVVGPQGQPLSLPDAVAQAKNGDTIELLPGEYRGAPLVIVNRRLTFKGVSDAAGKRPQLQADGKPGASKAIWLVRGGQVTVDNLEFRGARSSEGEGAGLRLEGGTHQILRSAFFDNEYGVHAINDPQATLSIEDSLFGLAPRVVGGLYHLLNVGRIAKLSVSGSRFQQGFEGQLIKTRARENSIRYNFIHDGPRGGASYEIEIAAGGLATVIGNVIGQGSESQNPALLAYGTEKPSWDKNRLIVAHNTFVNYGWTPALFVRVIDKNLSADTEVVAVNNLLAGLGLLWPAVTGRVEGNRFVARRALRDPDTYAFELSPSSWWRGSAVDPASVNGHDLTPRGEFDWPARVVPILVTPGRVAPGAYQR
jgi:hypothetical protein